MKHRNRDSRSEPRQNEDMSREGFRGSSRDRKDRHTGEEIRRERNRTERGPNPSRDVEIE